MTKKNKESLMGYDPLAWMGEEEGTPEKAEAMPDNGIEMHNTFSTDEVGAVEKPVVNFMDNEQPENNSVDDSSIITLEATLNIQNVSGLQYNLIHALQKNEMIEIDASAVNVIDTASLQLLVILKKEAIKENKKIIFDFPSDKFIEAAKLLGIDEILGVDQAAAGFF